MHWPANEPSHRGCSLYSTQMVRGQGQQQKKPMCWQRLSRRNPSCQRLRSKYSAIPSESFSIDYFLPVQVRDVKKILKKPKIDSSTAPDGISSRILKECVDVLAYPLALLIRRMLNDSRWPSVWKQHWIVPLLKRKSRADPGNYRGVHLTSQLSKATERVVGKFFQQFLQQSGAYGERQFAYSKGRSHRDALTLSVLTYLLVLDHDQMVVLYCSDVSGAFDKVDDERLLQKLASLKLHPRIYGLL